jgi:hypothetical protein
MARIISTKYSGWITLILILIAAILLFGAISLSSALSASATPSPTFTIKIPHGVEGTISVTLTNESDPYDEQTVYITDGSESASFNAYYDPDMLYTLNIAGMVGYEDYSEQHITGEWPDGYEINNLTVKIFSIITNVEPMEGGTVTSTVSDIPYGSDRTIRSEAASDYVIVSFIIDKDTPQAESVQNAVGKDIHEYLFEGITRNHTVYVVFAKKSGEVGFTFNSTDGTIADGRPGIIAFGGSIGFAQGVNPAKFTATANCEQPDGSGANYHIAEIKVNGVSLLAGATIDNNLDSYEYVFDTAITSPSVEVFVIFAIDTYTVTVDRDTNGSVGYDGADAPASILVAYGEEPSFEIMPNSEYTFSVLVSEEASDDNYQNVTGDPGATIYTMAAVKTDKTISILFDLIPTAPGGNIEDYLSFSPQPVCIEGADTITYFLPSNQTAEAMLLPVEGSGYQGIKYNNGSHASSFSFSDVTSGTILIDKDQYFGVAIQSNSGWRGPQRISLLKSAYIVFDGLKPTIDSIEISESNWTNAPVVTIYGLASDPQDASLDPASGVAKVVWSKGVPLTDDDVVRAEVTNVASMNDLGWYFEVSDEHNDVPYYVYAVDAVGNVSANEASVSVKIDRTSPEITGYYFGTEVHDDTSFMSEFMDSTELKYGFFFTRETVAVVKVEDSGPPSGLREVRYSLVSLQDETGVVVASGLESIDDDGLAKIPIPRDFKGKIVVEAFDNVGNFSDERTPLALVVEDTSPEINISNDTTTRYYDAAVNKLYISDMSLTVIVSDTGSGIGKIGYSQSAENESFTREIIKTNSTVYEVGDELEDGWTVIKTDANLVTEVTKTFTFSKDDNDIILIFDARDSSGNDAETAQSRKFTIDKTDPIINVVFRTDEAQNDNYYSANRIADVTVIERNFDSSLVKAVIENSFGQVPGLSAFTDISRTEHQAVIDFGEGDYTFDISSMDLGGHTATVNFSGGNEKSFFVDKTAPSIEENFIEFQATNQSFQDKHDSFNVDKTVNIRVTEHNFDPESVNLVVMRKEAGEPHNTVGFVDATDEVAGGRWEDSGDVHTISFTISRDAVYQVEITPVDLAGNAGAKRSTVVFEVDQTAPIVTAKNGSYVSEDDTEFLDIYPYSRKDEPVPTVEFYDKNIDHINYALTVYVPDHTNADVLTVIRPVQVYLDEDKDKLGVIQGNKFALPDFAKDGVYALELTAVDIAGNESLLNLNTYAKMIDQDVLAYILESSLEAKTGLYSFQYENGDAISKRPSSFSDIKIFVLAKKDTGVDIVLRDNNGEEMDTHPLAVVDNGTYGVSSYNFLLESRFFKENFQEDTDVLLHLTVKNQGNRIDLGTVHIDNIAPTCELPAEFNSWQWYHGEEDREITIFNINELIDEDQCKIYDNDNEIPFVYSDADNTVTFILTRGWHNVGIVLVDMAGNANNVQERAYIHVGYFWLWIIAIAFLVVIALMVFIVIRNRKKRKFEND